MSEELKDYENLKYTYKVQEGKVYTFYKDEKETDQFKKYKWCQRPAESNMSLKEFTDNGEVSGFMSESLATEKGLKKADLNEFIHNFVKLLIKELQAEKEKNRRLVDRTIKYDKTLENLQKDSISKDTIREKIEEVKLSKENYIFQSITSEDIRRTIMTNLQELLEE